MSTDERKEFGAAERDFGASDWAEPDGRGLMIAAIIAALSVGIAVAAASLRGVERATVVEAGASVLDDGVLDPSDGVLDHGVLGGGVSDGSLLDAALPNDERLSGSESQVSEPAGRPDNAQP